MFEKVKALCDKNNISMYKLEKILKLPRGSIDKLKTSKPSIDKVKKIADHFGVSIDKLLE